MIGTCPKHGVVDPCGGWSPREGNHLRCDASIPHCPGCGRTLHLDDDHGPGCDGPFNCLCQPDEIADDCTSDENCDHPTHYTGCPMQDEDPTAGFMIPQDR